jgi:hypothetical protein
MRQVAEATLKKNNNKKQGASDAEWNENEARLRAANKARNYAAKKASARNAARNVAKNARSNAANGARTKKAANPAAANKAAKNTTAQQPTTTRNIAVKLAKLRQTHNESANKAEEW